MFMCWSACLYVRYNLVHTRKYVLHCCGHCDAGRVNILDSQLVATSFVSLITEEVMQSDMESRGTVTYAKKLTNSPTY